MIELDPEVFLEFASKVTRLKMFPYFDLAHYILCCVAVREDLATGESCHHHEAAEVAAVCI